MIDLAMVWGAGVIAMIPVAVWWARDLSRIPGRIWWLNGQRRKAWQWAVLIGWAAGGWPAIVIVLVWSQSAVRKELIADAEDERQEYHLRH